MINHALVVRVLEVWLLMLDFQPCGDFDPVKPECFLCFGNHYIWRVGAKIPSELVDTVDDEILNASFTEYLNSCQLTNEIKLAPFGLDIYRCNCCNEIYIYISAATI